MNIQFILLQAAQGAQGGGNMLLWLIIIFAIMWLLMIRPQQKQAKKEREFRDSLKNGDRVMISGGIYGKVSSVDTTTINVEIDKDTVVTVEKSMVQPMPEQPAAKK